MYLAYALFCEGPSDYSYFEVLIPRVIESIVGSSAESVGRTEGW